MPENDTQQEGNVGRTPEWRENAFAGQPYSEQSKTVTASPQPQDDGPTFTLTQSDITKLRDGESIPIRKAPTNGAEIVAALPKRTAHALYGLICAVHELRMPPTAREVIVYDEASHSQHSTVAGLCDARRRGYCVNSGGVWATLPAGHDLWPWLEDRVLSENSEGGDRAD